MSWFGRWFHRRAFDGDLAEELRFHLEEQTQDLIAQGVHPREARRQAGIELSGYEQVKERTRDARGTRWLEDWWQDTRLAFRKMRRAPGFTAAAVLTVAVGVGANTAVFSLINALLLKTLPVSRPEELRALQRTGLDDDSYRFSFPGFEKLRERIAGEADLTAMSSLARMYAMINGRPDGALVQLVDGSWFPLLGVGATVGRLIGPGDNVTLGGHPVAVLSDRYWARTFGRDPSIVGSTLRLNGVALDVIGIAQPGFLGLTVGSEVDIWAPLVMQHELKYRGNASNHDGDAEKPWLPQLGVEWLTLVARIHPGASLPQVESAVTQQNRIAKAELFATRDSTERAFLLRERVVLPSMARGLSELREQFADPLVVLMASVGIVLLIACANLASLFLARGAATSHENALRLSLGARPGRLVRQALTESVTLALIGGAASLVLARWGGAALLHAASTRPNGIPLVLALDAKLLGFALGLSVLTGLVFGFAPALRGARTDLHASFKLGGRAVGASGGNRLPFSRVLVVSQIALSLVLATAAGLFAKTLHNLTLVDPGYDREHLVLARFDLLAAGYAEDQFEPFYQRLLETARGIPGVQSASLSLTGLAMGSQRISGFQVPGQVRPPEWDNSSQVNVVSSDFFHTVGIPLLRGRGFGPGDATRAPTPLVVSESMARHFFDTDDVVGRSMGYGSEPEFEIVGVARDARVNELREVPPRMAYVPLGSEVAPLRSLEVRVAGPLNAVIPAVQTAFATVDRNLPVREIVTLNELLGRGLQSEHFVSQLAGLFGALALLLAAIGLYGVTAYSVSRRSNEMGVRIALGAAPARVRRLVLRDTLTIVALGLILGIVLLVPTLSLLRSLVYGLSPHDPTTLAFGVGLLVVVGTAAGALPAWRASRVDPATALRSE